MSFKSNEKIDKIVKYRGISHFFYAKIKKSVRMRLGDSMFNIFKKKQQQNNVQEDDAQYNGITVKIENNIEESEKHFNYDFSVLKNKGIEKIIKKEFLPWLKGKEFKYKNDNKILEGLKLYEITYYYGKIVEKYSPINKEAFFGQFEFCFNSSSEYTADMLEAVAMQVYVYEGKVVKVSGYDI